MDRDEVFYLIIIISVVIFFFGIIKLAIEDDKKDNEKRLKYCESKVESGNYNSVEECLYILEKY